MSYKNKIGFFFAIKHYYLGGTLAFKIYKIQEIEVLHLLPVFFVCCCSLSPILFRSSFLYFTCLWCRSETSHKDIYWNNEYKTETVRVAQFYIIDWHSITLCENYIFKLDTNSTLCVENDTISNKIPVKKWPGFWTGGLLKRRSWIQIRLAFPTFRNL